MDLVECLECGGSISSLASFCQHCGHLQQEASHVPAENNYLSIAQMVQQAAPVLVKGGMFKRLTWFTLVNAAVILSLAVISGGALLAAAPIVLLIGCLSPFFILLFSKGLAKRVHHIKMIQPDNYSNDQEESLYQLIEAISKRAGLEKMPEIGIYESSDMNAFATGRSKKSSLVAVSSSLVNQMDAPGTAAVLAHEIAHIVNCDMVTMSLVQSVINMLVLLITIPLSLLKILAFFSDDIDVLTYYLISIFNFIISAILLFLGSLVVMAFSRRREFAADKLAANLINRDSMIQALTFLSGDTSAIPREQKAYAAFKINTGQAWFDIFSTHPSIERRIDALQKLPQANDLELYH